MMWAISSGYQDSYGGQGGDTITHVVGGTKEAIAGFEEVKPDGLGGCLSY